MDLYDFSQGDLKICQMHVDAFQERGRRGLSDISLPILANISAKLLAYLQIASSQREVSIYKQMQTLEAQI